MSAYTTQYDADFAGDPATGLRYTTYDQFKQATVALWNSALAVLSDAGSSAEARRTASQIQDAPVHWAIVMMPAFLSNSTVRANATSPSDAQMQAAADWIMATLY